MIFSLSCTGCKPGFCHLFRKSDFFLCVPFGNRQGQNRGFFSFYILQPIIGKIRLPIIAICFLNFTSVKLGKMLNYARFFENYARNLGPDLPSGAAGSSIHRRRVSSQKGAQPLVSLKSPFRILDPDPHPPDFTLVSVNEDSIFFCENRGSFRLQVSRYTPPWDRPHK